MHLSAMIKFLANRCRFHGSEPYVLDLEGDEGGRSLRGNPKAKTLLTIVGKEYTFETHKDLPIASRKEALLAAKHMKDVAPFVGQTYTVATSLEDGKTRVYFFTVKQSFIENQCRDSLFIIPESYLLFAGLSKGTVPNSIEGLFQQRSIKAALSKDGFSCMHSDTLGNREYGFDLADQNNLKSKTFEGSDYIKQLFRNITLLPSTAYNQALNFTLLKSFWSPHSAKVASIVAATFFTLYMSLASGYLIFKENSLSARLAEQQSSINELFEQQGQLEEMNAQLKALAENPLFEELSAPLWLLITELADNGADVSLVSSTGRDVTLRMKAAKSTDIMHFLAGSSALERPEIVSPAVKSGGKELFTVKFTLVSG